MNRDNGSSIVLQVYPSQARAEISLHRGANCFALALQCGDRLVDVLWSEPSFALGGGHPCGSGIPILFPFPGRIVNAQTSWSGHAYQLPLRDNGSDAIHGFAMDYAWRTSVHTLAPDGLRRPPSELVAEFATSDLPMELRACWPSAFCIRAHFRLFASRLEVDYMVRNLGEQPLPFGLGIHPYFRLPLGPAGTAGDCHIQLPVAAEWELQDLVATGQKHSLTHADDFQKGKIFSTLYLDAIYSDLVFDEPWCTAVLLDQANQCRLEWRFSRPFRECVVYTPPHREAICIEPWSCITDPLRMAQLGVDGGLLVLEQEGRQVFHTVIEVHKL